MNKRHFPVIAAAIAMIAALNPMPAHGKAPQPKAKVGAALEQMASETILKKPLDFELVPVQTVLDFISQDSGIKIFYSALKDDKTVVSLQEIPGPVTAADALHYVAKLANLTFIYGKDGVHFSPAAADKNHLEPAGADWLRVVDVEPFSNYKNGVGMVVLIRYSNTSDGARLFAQPYYQGKEAISWVKGVKPLVAGTGGLARTIYTKGNYTKVDEARASMTGRTGEIDAKMAVQYDGTGPVKQVEDLSKFKTAGMLWLYIEKLQNAASFSAADSIAGASAINLAAANFLKRFPKDARAWGAKLDVANTTYRLAHEGLTGFDIDTADASLKEIVAAPDAAPDIKSRAYMTIARISIIKGDDANIESTIAAYHRDHPADWNNNRLEWLIEDKLNSSAEAKKEEILNTLMKSSDPEIAAQAGAVLQIIIASVRMEELKTKPIDLKFTAVDGTAVDLTKMRGKVVLVDFWATWCGPCMAEVPKVVAASQKYHDQGFEVVGVSLDEDKDRMLQVAKAKGMTWPIHFDGKRFQNEIAAHYGISGIPVLWLVDKQGMVTQIKLGEDFTPQLEKMLAE